MQMQHTIVRLAWRQYIDADTTTPFEAKVFNASWSEFLIQRQSFSKGLGLHTWDDIRATFPKADPALPFKVSFSISGILNAQNKRIPGLPDALGDHTIPFENYRFHLIASDARDRSKHKISITYYTGDLTLLAILGDQLLLTKTPPFTFQLKLQPGLSIISYQPAPEPGAQKPTPQTQGPGIPGSQNPSNQTPSNQDPNVHVPGSQNPSNQDPNVHVPDSQTPSNQDPNVHVPGSQTPSNQTPSNQTPAPAVLTTPL